MAGDLIKLFRLAIEKGVLQPALIAVTLVVVVAFQSQVDAAQTKSFEEYRREQAITFTQQRVAIEALTSQLQMIQQQANQLATVASNTAMTLAVATSTLERIDKFGPAADLATRKDKAK